MFKNKVAEMFHKLYSFEGGGVAASGLTEFSPEVIGGVVTIFFHPVG